MHLFVRVALLLALLTAIGCGGGGRALPLRASPFPEPELTLIWHGTGQASRLEEGQWRRAPEHDYELTVVQRRYAERWESTKEMHRRHPDYDGSAGPRDQTLHFTLELGRAEREVPLSIHSTLGDGRGRSDLAFQSASLRIDALVSSMAPFDTYIIEQRYAYDAGRLEETVRLVRAGEAGDTEWVRIEEQAVLYAATRFDQPPTRVVAAR